jgi:LysR family transcriptional regulator, benzoate and cis,cis-muconate-responsive activator of ben and cat genes
MELRHLRYFIAVAEERSFSRAAEKLHLSQPPLSRQIRDLEVELGVKLLDRNRQGVRLTRIGRGILAKARALIRDADLFKAQARILCQEIREEIRLGYAPSPTAPVMSKLLATYHQLVPGGRLTLQDLTHTEMLSGLQTKKLQVALTLRPRSKELRGLRFEMISRHRVGVICSLESPLAGLSAVQPSIIANNELIFYRAQDFPEYHQWVAEILGVSISALAVAQECDDVLGVVAAVESGRGVAIVGEFITAVAGNRVRFIPFASKPHFLEVGVLYRPHGLSESTKKLIAACTACGTVLSRPLVRRSSGTRDDLSAIVRLSRKTEEGGSAAKADLSRRSEAEAD